MHCITSNLQHTKVSSFQRFLAIRCKNAIQRNTRIEIYLASPCTATSDNVKATQCMVQCCILYSWKFLSGENFRQFHHLLSLAKFLSTNFCPVLIIYIEDMVTFTALVKIYPTEYFRGSWAWRNFCPAKIFNYTVL